MKSLKRCLLFGLACAIIGYSVRIALDVFATRIAWHIGGEALVLLCIPAAIWVGMHLGARMAYLPIEKPQKSKIPYSGITR